MATKKISGYTEKTTLADDDLFLLEQAAGTYRKFSSSRVTKIITSNTTLTVGTGGDFADYVTAMAYLRNKWIPANITVTLYQVSDLSLTSRSSYTQASGYYSILEMDHPCSRNISVNTNGYSTNIGNGSDESCNGFTCQPNCRLNIYSGSGGAGTIITSNYNGHGYALHCFSGGEIYNNNSALYPITLGANGHGFEMGVSARNNSFISCGYLNAYYNSYGVYTALGGVVASSAIDIANNSNGFYAIYNSFIYGSGATGAQATSASPTIQTVGNHNSYIY